jgi:1,4-alpha-glucan branching enzyme
LPFGYYPGVDMTEETPKLVRDDSWLTPYTGAIAYRGELAKTFRSRVTCDRLSLPEFAVGHNYFGLHKLSSSWVLRERAPNATRIALVGDFTGWMEDKRFELVRRDHGTWDLSLPLGSIKHGDHYKLIMYWNDNGREVSGERIPSFCTRVVQDEATKLFSAQVWDPKEPYRWKHPDFRVPNRAPLIYEAHVGMAQEEGKVGSYREFTEKVLPRIKEGGYNTIQLMAVQEHPYYGSFGYQVSNFFAPSSRFGTPDELMELVDTAHGLGIAVIMDLIHSHAVKNEAEGLSRFDGSYDLYFHSGPRGEHPAWNTRLFDYGKSETLHLLLSNCRYWLDAFKFDGYRFDGVTSMIYRDHGLGSAASSYDHYFCGNVDEDALAYLSLANSLIHEVRSDAITIAEEVSGMPGLAAPISDGGIGFDYRLAMGIPDYWIKLLKHTRDEDWNVSQIWHELTNRRADERTVNYVESHDQALVGDKTTMFWLADAEMYSKMRVSDESLIIDRALALHKMLRLVTLSTSGHGYLNFIGNEFGHPEWVDFPREGNGWSYHYARRQWSLRDSRDLKYRFLADFDRSMIGLAESDQLLQAPWPYKHYEHVDDKLLVFERAGLVFIFNFHPSNSYAGREVWIGPGRYAVALDSDSREFGGFGRVDPSVQYEASPSGGVRLYIPSRSALVLKRL